MAANNWTGLEGDALNKALGEYARHFEQPGVVRVGFLEDATYPDGTNVAMVAATQEFGAPSVGIPPRPFFRPMIAKEVPSMGKTISKIIAHYGYDTETVLGVVGEYLAGKLRESIIDVTGPQLSDVTLLLRDRFWSNPEDITFADVAQARHDVADGVRPEASGSQAKPLVWSGHMLNSVASEVEMGKVTE